MGTVDCDPKAPVVNSASRDRYFGLSKVFPEADPSPLEGGQKKAMVQEPWLNLYFSTYHLN
jgi:hypothetical protein